MSTTEKMAARLHARYMAAVARTTGPTPETSEAWTDVGGSKRDGFLAMAAMVLRACDAIGKIRAEDVDHARLGRINGEGGALSWCGRSFALHPDRCTCQGNDQIPHRHYDHAPYRCARCGDCNAYSPVSNGTQATSETGA
jgi:hypothetical protein